MVSIISEFTSYLSSPLGDLEVSATEEYISSIHFVESIKRPSPRKPSTEYVPDSIHELTFQLEEYFSGKRKTFDIAFKQEGTAFQQLVWKELENIPFGKTISYLELSRRIGNEKAIRAVGTTNGLNQMSLIVPCHRVIGSNGSLVGYGGDLWRKKWLLAHEAKVSGSYQMELFGN